MARKVVFILFLISLLISFFFFRSYFYSKKEIPSLLDRVPDADLLGRIKVLEIARQASSMLYYNKLPFRDLLTPEFLLAQAKNYGLDIQRPSYFFGNLDGEYGALLHVNDSSKIYAGIARIAKGSKDPLIIGNLEALRDWGHAKDYVEAMHLMVQQKTPDDYVIATGRTLSVRYLIETAFDCANISLDWYKTRNNEFASDRKTGHILVMTDNKYRRPNEVDFLQGIPAKAKDNLGWAPNIQFEQLIEEMVRHDIG